MIFYAKMYNSRSPTSSYKCSQKVRDVKAFKTAELRKNKRGTLNWDTIRNLKPSLNLKNILSALQAINSLKNLQPFA